MRNVVKGTGVRIAIKILYMIHSVQCGKGLSLESLKLSVAVWSFISINIVLVRSTFTRREI